MDPAAARHRFEYAGVEGAPFGVPTATPPTVLAAPTTPARDADALLRAALDRPAGAEPLRDLASGARDVLVIVDDNTRATPTHALLPHVARELEAAAVADDRVTILTAQGTHRRMTGPEIDAKLGAFARRWRVRQHDWRDEDALVSLGETTGGMPIVVNRLVADADVVVGVGQVGAHAIMGYSGGAKIVHPGASGGATETWTHWTAAGHPIERLMGVVENPIRREIEAGARAAGLDAVLNVVLGPGGRVLAAAYGDLVRAQRECARSAFATHAAALAAPAPLVVTDSAPADRDYWQSAKGLYCGTLAAAEGGVIVMASPNPEGVAANHPELLDLAGLDLDEIRARVEGGRVHDVIAAAVAAFTARIRERSDVHLVSSGIAPADARRLGFTPFATVQDAVDAAVEKVGRDAPSAVLHGAGGLLPVVGGRNDHLARPIPRPRGP